MKHILNTFITAATALFLTACAEDGWKGDDWQAGAADSEDSPQVFFSPDNSTAFEFTTEEDVKTFEVKLQRLNSTNEVTVPLTSEVGDEHIKVPSSVTFPAGVDEATITVDCDGMAELQSFNMKISIPDDYAGHYAAGSTTFEAPVAVVGWITVDDNFMYTFCDKSDTPLYDPQYGELQLLQGTKKLRLTNFCGSGKELYFTLSATYSGCSETFIGVVPYANWVATNNDYDNWYFYDDEAGEYPRWKLGNTDIYYFYAYGYGYCYLNLTDTVTYGGEVKNYGCFSAYFCYDDGDWESYDYIYVWCYFNVPDNITIPYDK